MTDTAALVERLDTIETRITFQDQTIEELNATITAQWRVIDGLTRKIALLEEHARTADSASDPRNEPPPPHY